MLRRVALVRTDGSEELSPSIIKVTRISELGTMLAVTSVTGAVTTIFVFLVRFEVFTAVTMKNGVFWDAGTCGSCKNRRFVGT
jgi:hypothetical protein